MDAEVRSDHRGGTSVRTHIRRAGLWVEWTKLWAFRRISGATTPDGKPDLEKDASLRFELRALASGLAEQLGEEGNAKPAYPIGELIAACAAVGMRPRHLCFAMAMFGVGGNRFGRVEVGSLAELRQHLARSLADIDRPGEPSGFDFHEPSILLYPPRPDTGPRFRGGGFGGGGSTL